MRNPVLEALAKYPALEELHYKYRDTIVSQSIHFPYLGILDGLAPCERGISLQAQAGFIKNKGFDLYSEPSNPKRVVCNRDRFKEFGIPSHTNITPLFEEVFELNQGTVYVSSSGNSVFKLERNLGEYAFETDWRECPQNHLDTWELSHAFEHFVTSNPPIPPFFIGLRYIKV